MRAIVKDCRTCGQQIQLVRRADAGPDRWDALDTVPAPDQVRDKRRARITVGGYSWRLDQLIAALLADRLATSHRDAERTIRHDNTFRWHAVHRCTPALAHIELRPAS